MVLFIVSDVILGLCLWERARDAKVTFSETTVGLSSHRHGRGTIPLPFPH
jgi:hypothetical protein